MAKTPTPAQLKYWRSKRALTPEQIALIKYEYANTNPRPSHAALARKYGVSHHTIFLALNRQHDPLPVVLPTPLCEPGE